MTAKIQHDEESAKGMCEIIRNLIKSGKISKEEEEKYFYLKDSLLTSSSAINANFIRGMILEEVKKASRKIIARFVGIGGDEDILPPPTHQEIVDLEPELWNDIIDNDKELKECLKRAQEISS